MDQYWSSLISKKDYPDTIEMNLIRCMDQKLRIIFLYEYCSILIWYQYPIFWFISVNITLDSKHWWMIIKLSIYCHIMKFCPKWKSPAEISNQIENLFSIVDSLSSSKSA